MKSIEQIQAMLIGIEANAVGRGGKDAKGAEPEPVSEHEQAFEQMKEQVSHASGAVDVHTP